MASFCPAQFNFSIDLLNHHAMNYIRLSQVASVQTQWWANAPEVGAMD